MKQVHSWGVWVSTIGRRGFWGRLLWLQSSSSYHNNTVTMELLPRLALLHHVDGQNAPSCWHILQAVDITCILISEMRVRSWWQACAITYYDPETRLQYSNWMPTLSWARSPRWLTLLTLDETFERYNPEWNNNGLTSVFVFPIYPLNQGKAFTPH